MPWLERAQSTKVLACASGMCTTSFGIFTIVGMYSGRWKCPRWIALVPIVTVIASILVTWVQSSLVPLTSRLRRNMLFCQDFCIAPVPIGMSVLPPVLKVAISGCIFTLSIARSLPSPVNAGSATSVMSARLNSCSKRDFELASA